MTLAFAATVVCDRGAPPVRLAAYGFLPVAAAGCLLGRKRRLATWAKRCLGFLPFLAVVFFLRPLSRGSLVEVARLGASCWACAAAVCLYGTLFDLTVVTGAMARAGLGGTLLDVVALAHRYLGTIAAEARRLEAARNARYFGGRWAGQASLLGNMAGSLLLRSLERGERVYAAMVSRGHNAGWDRCGPELELGPGSAPESEPQAFHAPPTVPALCVAAVCFGYPGGPPVLKDASLTVMPGQKLGLIGLSGAGKTTLLMTCAGLLRPESGSVQVTGRPVWPASEGQRRRARREVGFVFQNPDDQLFMPTVGEDVAFGPINLGLSSDEVSRRVRAALAAVGAAGYEDRIAYHLSAGEKKRVALATVLSMSPRLVLLDEPTGDLDPKRRREIISIIRRTNAAMVIATHDLDLVRDCCDYVAILADGRVAVSGPTPDIFGDRALLAAFELA